MTFLLLPAGLSFQAIGEPATASGFSDAVLPLEVSFEAPVSRQRVGALALPTDATVESGFVDLEGAPSAAYANFTHEAAGDLYTEDARNDHIQRLEGTLQLEVADGATVFAAQNLSLGAHDGTQVVGGAVVSQRDGAPATYTTARFSVNRPSFGRVIADITPGGQGSWVQVSLLNSTGAVVLDNLAAGDHIPTPPGASLDYRLRVRIYRDVAVESPRIVAIGAGYVLYDAVHATGQGSLDSLTRNEGRIVLAQSLAHLTPYSGNPILSGVAGTYYQGGIRVGSMVAVGREVWAYFSSTGNDGVIRFGRMVSADGGWNWSVDTTPTLSPTPGAWDRTMPEPPFAMRASDGRWMLWYSGFNGTDSIGLATSLDGRTWTKHPSNPVLRPSPSGWDNGGVIDGVVVEALGQLFMYYGGRTSSDARKSMGVATSSDGVNWTKYAGNPVIGRGSYAEGSYEVWPAPSLYHDGMFYIFWSCASGSAAYDSCLSTSTDGFNVALDPRSPVISHGTASWNQYAAARPAYAFDPVTGHLFFLYEGYGGGLRYVGRADGNYEPEGRYTKRWNLTAEIPRSFLSHRADAVTPAGTSLEFQLARWPPGWEANPAEAVGPDDRSIELDPPPWLEERVRFSTTSNSSSPLLRSTAIAYDCHFPSGQLHGPAMEVPTWATRLTVTAEFERPAGTTLSIYANGQGPHPLQPAEPLVLPVPAADATFAYRLDLSGQCGHSPQIRTLTFSFSGEGSPRDVRLEVASGVLLAEQPGWLAGPRRLPLDPAPLNELLAPYRSHVPRFDLEVGVFVNSTVPGRVTISRFELNLSLPDHLAVKYLPDAPLLLVELGDTLAFSAIAWSTAGPILYEWSFDGQRTGSEQPTFAPGPPLLRLGNHTVEVVVRSGALQEARAWEVRVIQPAPTLAVAYYPPVHHLDLPMGARQLFLVAATSSLGNISIDWQFDGRPAGQGNEFEIEAPRPPSYLTVTVTVSDGHDTLGWWWIVNSTGAGPAGDPLDVTFTPAHDVVLAVGDAQRFEGSGRGGTPGHWRWTWSFDGGPVPGTHALDVQATGPLVGTHQLWVAVTDGTSFALYRWRVDVVPAPPPPAPAISILEPADGSSVQVPFVDLVMDAANTTSVRVASADATLGADGFWRLRVPLEPGANTITATAFGVGNRSASDAVHVTYEPPQRGSVVGTDAEFPLWLLALLVAVAAAVLAVVRLRVRPPTGGEPPGGSRGV